MAKLPTVTSAIPRDLRTFVDRVREALDTGGPDAVITARQLVAAGVATYTGNVLGPAGSVRYSTPPRPQNVEAEGALANIMVTWDKPVYTGHAYAEIWAAAQTDEQEASDTNPTIGEAELVGMSPGVFFAHNLGAGAKRWYWVRFVNFAGEAGPYQSTEGVVGETSLDPQYVLEVLTGAITQSQLYSDLSTKVDRIDTKTRVFRQETAPTGTVENPLVDGDIWINTAITYYDDYATGDYVIRANRMHRWDADAGEWVDFMDFGFQDWFTAINTEKTTRETEDEALTQSITSLTAAVAGNLSTTNAAITAEQTARANADSAIAGDVTSLQALVDNNNTTTLAAITAEQTARSNVDGALASDISTIQADYLTSVDETAINAAISGEAIARVNADGALSQTITTLEAGIAPDIAAAVATETSARVAADGSIEAKNTVKIDVAGHVSGYGLISTLNDATPTSEFGIRADTFFLAPPTNTDATEPTENLYPGFVWLQNGDAENYDVKYYTGLGWSTTPQNLPFVVRTSPTVINGESVPVGVYMQDAYIANGTITNAKIGNAAIDDAKIANLDAGKITTGYLDANRIEAGSIDADMIDSRGLSIKDAAGNVILSAGSPLTVGNVSGLGALATANDITISSVTDAGALASANVYRGPTQPTNADNSGDLWVKPDANGNDEVFIYYADATPAAVAADVLNIAVGLTPTLTELNTVVGGYKIADINKDGRVGADDSLAFQRIASNVASAAELAHWTNVVQPLLPLVWQPAGSVGAVFGSAGGTGGNITGQITTSNVSTYIANAAIQTAQIADAAIGNAQIGNVIQSSSYNAGSAGWKIDKTGAAEFNDATFRGTLDITGSSGSNRLEITGDTIKVIDSSNVVRVKIGDLS